MDKVFAPAITVTFPERRDVVTGDLRISWVIRLAASDGTVVADLNWDTLLQRQSVSGDEAGIRQSIERLFDASALSGFRSAVADYAKTRAKENNAARLRRSPYAGEWKPELDGEPGDWNQPIYSGQYHAGNELDDVRLQRVHCRVPWAPYTVAGFQKPDARQELRDVGRSMSFRRSPQDPVMATPQP
jgi:hypothetical protein